MHQKLKKGFARFFTCPQAIFESLMGYTHKSLQTIKLTAPQRPWPPSWPICKNLRFQELFVLQQKLFSLDTNHLRASTTSTTQLHFSARKRSQASCITTRTPARSIERMIFTCNMQILYQLIAACFMKRRALALVVKIRGSNDDENEWTKYVF